MNGKSRLKISQMSIILTYEVFGKLFETLMNMVVNTSIAEKKLGNDSRYLPVRLTVTTASKKNGLKKLVA